jgi:uncharacterized protein GlcG (DUF336 family)
LLADSAGQVIGAVGVSGLAPADDQQLADSGSGVIERLSKRG